MRKISHQVGRTIFAAIIVMVGVGCGAVPSAYRGEFQDAAKGVRLELEARKGVFQDAQGKKIDSKASDLKFESLEKGIAGIYVSTSPVSENKLEVYWVNPDLSTRQEAAGLVWVSSEVIYTLFDLSQKDDVREIELSHCEKGTVLLDTLSQRYQIGCPAEIEFYKLTRVK